MGVTFCAVAPEHPLAAHAAAAEPRARRVHRASARTAARPKPNWRRRKRRACRPACSSTHPLTGEPVDGLGRQLRADGLRRRRGDGRAGARRARLRVRQEVRPADHAGDRTSTARTSLRPSWQDWYADKERGVTHQLRQLQRPRTTRTRSTRSPPRSPQSGLGEKKTTWRLRDWGISRQRYWGTPIPIIHCDALRRRAGAREGPAGRAAARTACPTARGNPLEQARRLPARRTARRAASRRGARPTRWTPSSIRPGTTCATATRAATRRWSARGNDYWMPMDQYIGGIEHAILHLLYARFWTKVMRDLGLVKIDEPFTRLLTQGMVLNEAFYRERRGRQADYWFNPADVDADAATTRAARSARRCKADGQPVELGGIDEDVEVQEQRRRSAGPDRAVRRRHRAPVHDVRVAARADAGMERRRRRRRAPLPAPRLELRRQARRRASTRRRARDRGAAGKRARRCAARSTRCCGRSSYDYERMQYNTVVSGAMKLLNALEGCKRCDDAGAATRRCARASASCCACSTRSRRTSPMRCGASSATRQRTATCSTRPGRRSTRRRWCRTRSSWCCRSTASCAARSGCRPSADKARDRGGRAGQRRVRQVRRGPARRRRSIVVPGRLVNVVV